MNIAVLSGKGGTGKTFVSVNLAAAAPKAVYIDCDVEEPNGHLFFKPENLTEEKIIVKLPVVDYKLCSGCRKCVDFCEFNALAYIGGKVKIFDEVCHSCGGCMLVCPAKAISEKDKIIGNVQRGHSKAVSVNTGILNTGEASGIPIIKNLLQNIKNAEHQINIIDCPPGSSCIVMESIKDADYCILVAEPTIFGLHNLKMVYELVQLFSKPFGVVLNKCLNGKNPAEEFCIKENVEILCKIPFDKMLGTENSNAHIIVRQNIKYNELFASLLEKVHKEVQRETVTSA
jgi:MinD superfamily P-loop ATPase